MNTRGDNWTAQARSSPDFHNVRGREERPPLGRTLRGLPCIGGSSCRRHRRKNGTTDTKTVLHVSWQTAHKLHYSGFREVGNVYDRRGDKIQSPLVIRETRKQKEKCLSYYHHGRISGSGGPWAIFNRWAPAVHSTVNIWLLINNHIKNIYKYWNWGESWFLIQKKTALAIWVFALASANMVGIFSYFVTYAQKLWIISIFSTFPGFH